MELARPLNELTQKNKVFKWTAECQQSFEALKARFSKSPILLMPDPTKPFVVAGAVLRQ